MTEEKDLNTFVCEGEEETEEKTEEVVNQAEGEETPTEETPVEE
jgi:hypothetical protein